MQKRYIETSKVFDAYFTDGSSDATSDIVSLNSASEYSLWVKTEGADGTNDSTCKVKLSVLCSPDQILDHFATPNPACEVAVNSFTTTVVKLVLPITRYIIVKLSYPTGDDGNSRVTAVVQHS